MTSFIYNSAKPVEDCCEATNSCRNNLFSNKWII